MSMHEQTPPADTDALEQRLRRHLTATYGPPPAPDDVWQCLAGRLADPDLDGHVSAPSDSSAHLIDTNADLTHPHLRQTRALAFSTPAALPALAAVLLIAVLAAVILGPLRPHGDAAPVPTSTAGPRVEIPLPTYAPGQYQVHILQPDEVVPGVSFIDMRVFPSGEGWAVGQMRTGSSSYESAIYHLKDGRWLPADDVFPNVSLSALSMLSPTEGWAAGVLLSTPTSAERPVVLHYSGGHWTLVTPPPGAGSITNLAMVSPMEGWATLYSPNNGLELLVGPKTTLFHFQNGTWTVFDTGGLQLTALAMVSPSEGWAAGFHGVIAHYQSGRWTRWPTSTPGDFPGITMISPTDGWMSGTIPSPDSGATPDRSFTLHYDGRDWRPFTMPALPSLPPGRPNVPASGSSLNIAVTSFSMLSSTEGWAAGDNQGAASAIYHYTGGAWHLENVAVNQSLETIAMVSPDEGWALGAERIIAVGNEAAVILHYAHGVWSIYKP